MTGRSLGTRLVAGAALWIALALLATGFILEALFRSHVESALEARLSAELNQIAGAVAIGSDGRPTLTRRLADPLFDRPYSGRYWQIDAKGVAPERSRSLWDTTLPLPADDLPDGALHRHRLTGPAGQDLLVLERGVTPTEAETRLRIAVAADLAELAEPLARFRWTLAMSLTVLGLGLVGAVLLQVHYGLQPLARLRSALAELRAGRRERLKGDWPAEVRPLVEDFDAVLDHSAQILERARTQAGNLAHALKTPISVLANEADAQADPLAETVRQQVASMRRHIDHHLARARAAAAATRPGARADVAGIAHQLARTLGKLHQARGIAITVESDGMPLFRGDPQDLMEMLGNLMENACIWARMRVLVRLQAAGDRTLVVVDDDGPGLPSARRDEALARGTRFDESVPGSGLGLAIARDLAELYGGTIALADSPLGGLSARLDLPGLRNAP